MELHDINSLNRNELSEYQELTFEEIDKERAFDNFIDCEIDRLKEEEFEKKSICAFCGERGKPKIELQDKETLQAIVVCCDCYNLN